MHWTPIAVSVRPWLKRYIPISTAQRGVVRADGMSTFMREAMFEGRWRSPTGAEIHLVQCGDAISGTYTAEADDATMPCRGRVLIGTAEEGIIGFVTSCRAPHMITSWTGRLVQSEGSGTPEIHAVRHAVDRLSQQLDMARSVSLKKIVFKRFQESVQNRSYAERL